MSDTANQPWTGQLKADEAKGDKRRRFHTKHMSELHPAQKKLTEVTKSLPNCNMLSSTDQMMLFSIMIKSMAAKKCIDVGVYTGLSSLTIALGMPEGGKVVSCDIESAYTDIGRPVWEEAGVADKIDLRIAPASDTLQSLIDNGESGTFDFAYIDADKTGYDTYYEKCLTLLRKGGVVAVDNVYWHGQVDTDEPCKDPSARAIQLINAKITADKRVLAVMIQCGDGVYICTKL